MKSIILLLITFYKSFISPFLEAIFGRACRFEITCSEYTLGAVKKYGALKGVHLGLVRLSRCHPYAFVIARSRRRRSNLKITEIASLRSQ